MSGRRGRIARVAAFVVAAIIASQLSPLLAFAADTGVVNVRDFGAKGDGITEDTAAFQAAVNAAAGKTLSIPAGTYLVGRINITTPMDVVGAGMSLTLLKAKDYINDSVFYVDHTRNVNFSDFEIDGNRFHISGGKPCGIFFTYTSDCLVQRVNIHDCDKTGVCVYEGSTRVIVRDSTFADNENDIEFHKATYNQAINNVCRNTRTESIANYEERYGPQVTGHNVVAYNKMYDSYAGVNVQKAHWNDVHDNYIENCIWGVVVIGFGDDTYVNTYNNTIRDNVIVGGPLSAQGSALQTDYRAYDTTFSGNVVKDWPYGPMGPVQLEGPRSVFVDNQVLSAGQQIEISANDTVFARNLISRTKGIGVTIDRNVSNVRIENNTFEYCDDLALMTYATVSNSAVIGNTMHSNCRTASGPALWVRTGTAWSNSVFANNRVYDDLSSSQEGVVIRGTGIAVSGNSVSGASTWTSASAGAVVDIGTAASDGYARWTCTTSGAPGTWSPSDAVVAPSSATPPPNGGSRNGGGRKVKRIAGADRYGTAVAISADSFTSASTVVLATGAEYADALAASSLAGALDAPLLLTDPKGVREDVFAEIARLHADEIIIVGGEAAVASNVDLALKARGLKVERIAGSTRFATSAAVAARVSGGRKAGTVFVARGDDFADALSVSPLAYAQGFPVLLTRTAALPAETEAALRAMAPAHVVVLGGTSAVGPGVEGALKGLCPDVTRVAGSTRYATSAAIARYAISKGWASPDSIGIAAGDRFPDALGGGAASGNAGGLLLLTPPRALSGEARVALGELMNDRTQIALYGGVGAVFATVESDVRALAL